MTKVSSGKKKQGPPAHQNSYAFHHNKSSKLTKHIGSLPIRFLCPPCVAVIEWRKKYRKYKPLTVVKKCTRCGQKKVKDAYHVICGDCVRETQKCGKCLLHTDQWLQEGQVPATSIEGLEDEDDCEDEDECEEVEEVEEAFNNHEEDEDSHSIHHSESDFDSEDSNSYDDSESS